MFPTLACNEEYIHGFHLPLVRDSQRVQAWGDESEVKTIPFVPVSHPFLERLICTIQREYLLHMLLWNESDLKKKLETFKEYYNGFRIY
jgi:hypothetical protein